MDLLIIGGISVNRNANYTPQKDIIRLDMETLKPRAVSSRTHPISGMQEFQRHCALNFNGKVIIIGRHFTFFLCLANYSPTYQF